VYRVLDGKPKEQGSFPEATVGAPIERRLPMFLRDFFGPGDYKVETRKPTGHFEQSFDFSIAESDDEPDNQPVIDIDSDDLEFEESTERFEQNYGQMGSTEVENLLLKERLKRIEDEFSRQKIGNQSEMQTLISALEESRREQRELMLMMLNRSQQPQQDATAQAMNILERSLGIVTKAKAISEEIAPSEQGSSGGSFLADGAKLIDSLGRNAGTFLPLLMSGLQASVPRMQPGPRPVILESDKPASNGEGSNLTDLAKKIRKKEETK